MKLTITLSDYVEKDLLERFGGDEEKKAEFVSRFLAWKEADMTNWTGKPHCIHCGESISPDDGYPGRQDVDGGWYHIFCSGVWN